MYVYLIGSLILALFWAAFYLLRKDLRKKMLLSSLVGCVLGGLGEGLYIPSYWDPDFPRIILFWYPFDLDSFIYSFFLGGIASVFYQVLWRKPLFDTHHVKAKILYVAIAIFFAHLAVPGLNIIYTSILGFAASALLCGYFEKDLRMPIFLNGLVTFLFFAVTYPILWHVFPSLQTSYNDSVLTGIRLAGVPVEELLFHASFGAVWCVLYELFGNSRLRKFFAYFYT